MFVEIVDALRCPRAHEESWLVLAAQRTEDRHVLEGTLGCPVCHATYPIHGGIAEFPWQMASDRSNGGQARTLPPAPPRPPPLGDARPRRRAWICRPDRHLGHADQRAARASRCSPAAARRPA